MSEICVPREPASHLVCRNKVLCRDDLPVACVQHHCPVAGRGCGAGRCQVCPVVHALDSPNLAGSGCCLFSARETIEPELRSTSPDSMKRQQGLCSACNFRQVVNRNARFPCCSWGISPPGRQKPDFTSCLFVREGSYPTRAQSQPI